MDVDTYRLALFIGGFSWQDIRESYQILRACLIFGHFYVPFTHAAVFLPFLIAVDGLNANPAFPNTPIGIPKAKGDNSYPLSYDNSLAKKLLGRDFITLEKSARDTAAQFVEKRWW